MNSLSVITVILAAASVINCTSAFSSGAPVRSAACNDLVQRHHQVTPDDCKPPCPFSVRLLAIDGTPPKSPRIYKCGSIHAVRIESRGPKFRGFAIQARESTESFTKGAKFVGEFVNPPSKGEWRIWRCAAPCATHSQATNKTSVDLTWWVPSPASDSVSNVTLWLAITREFKLVHTHIRGLDLIPDPVTCVL